MKRTWVMVANKAGAKIFERKGDRPAQLFHTFDHAKGTMKEGEFNSDRSGTLFRQGIVREDQSIKHENERFAKVLSSYLENGRTGHLFDDFILIAGPGFNGVIQSKFNKELTKLLAKNIVKEIPLRDEKRIQEILKYD